MDWDLDPLEVVGKKQAASSCKSPASAVLTNEERKLRMLTNERRVSPVTDCLGRDLLVIELEELDGGHIGVIQVEGLLQGDDADVMVKVRSVPALMILHGLDGYNKSEIHFSSSHFCLNVEKGPTLTSGLVTTLKISVVSSGHNLQTT